MEVFYSVFQNGWILVKMLGGVMLGYLSVFPFVEFQLDFVHENQLLKSNINKMFENGCK